MKLYEVWFEMCDEPHSHCVEVEADSRKDAVEKAEKRLETFWQGLGQNICWKFEACYEARRETDGEA